ncbi:hypothetical protein ACFL7D_03555 [candidate division KSB1 bacterium]
MKTNTEEKESRREFFKSGLRNLMLGGIVAVSGFLGWREIRSEENENLCTVNLPCRDCSKFTDCTEPDALKLIPGHHKKPVNYFENSY